MSSVLYWVVTQRVAANCYDPKDLRCVTTQKRADLISLYIDTYEK